MSDPIERLRDITRKPPEREVVADEIERLEARLADAERDARRYRWLKANHLQLGPDCWIRTGEDLDDATDAALAAQEDKA